MFMEIQPRVRRETKVIGVASVRPGPLVRAAEPDSYIEAVRTNMGTVLTTKVLSLSGDYVDLDFEALGDGYSIHGMNMICLYGSYGEKETRKWGLCYFINGENMPVCVMEYYSRWDYEKPYWTKSNYAREIRRNSKWAEAVYQAEDAYVQVFGGAMPRGMGQKSQGERGRPGGPRVRVVGPGRFEVY